jgi:hypothetical protein
MKYRATNKLSLGILLKHGAKMYKLLLDNGHFFNAINFDNFKLKVTKGPCVYAIVETRGDGSKAIIKIGVSSNGVKRSEQYGNLAAENKVFVVIVKWNILNLDIDLELGKCFDSLVCELGEDNRVGFLTRVLMYLSKRGAHGLGLKRAMIMRTVESFYQDKLGLVHSKHSSHECLMDDTWGYNWAQKHADEVAHKIKKAMIHPVLDIRVCSSWPSSLHENVLSAAICVLQTITKGRAPIEDAYSEPVHANPKGTAQVFCEDYTDEQTRVAVGIIMGYMLWACEKHGRILLLDSNDGALGKGGAIILLLEHAWILIFSYRNEIHVYTKNKSYILIHRPCCVMLSSREGVKFQVKIERSICCEIILQVCWTKEDLASRHSIHERPILATYMLHIARVGYGLGLRQSTAIGKDCLTPLEIMATRPDTHHNLRWRVDSTSERSRLELRYGRKTDLAIIKRSVNILSYATDDDSISEILCKLKETVSKPQFSSYLIPTLIAKCASNFGNRIQASHDYNTHSGLIEKVRIMNEIILLTKTEKASQFCWVKLAGPVCVTPEINTKSHNEKFAFQVNPARVLDDRFNYNSLMSNWFGPNKNLNSRYIPNYTSNGILVKKLPGSECEGYCVLEILSTTLVNFPGNWNKLSLEEFVKKLLTLIASTASAKGEPICILPEKGSGSKKKKESILHNNKFENTSSGKYCRGFYQILVEQCETKETVDQLNLITGKKTDATDELIEKTCTLIVCKMKKLIDEKEIEVRKSTKNKELNCGTIYSQMSRRGLN